MTLSEYLIEAVAKRSTGKYSNQTIHTIQRGDRLQLKRLEELPGYPKFKMEFGCPVIGRSRVTIWECMQEHLGEIVTVESVNVNQGTVTDREYDFIWPIEACEL